MDNMEQFDEAWMHNADMFTRMWADLASKMAMSGFSVASGSTPPEAARQMRGTFFKTMAEYADEYMRSPQFLDNMRQSMDGALKLRKQVNEFLTEVQHEFQAPARSDIDSLMLGLRHMETRVLDRMEELAARLDTFEHKIEELGRRLGRGHDGEETLTPHRHRVASERAEAKARPRNQRKSKHE